MAHIKTSEKDFHKRAHCVLLRANSIAVEKRCMIECEYKSFIDSVLGSTHKTFKYILVTALLAKATDEFINPLCLQAGSKLDGAYDARSLCHKVLVKFEMTELCKALGGSNEPYLNKPARFPELDISNPVRAGKDRCILTQLCNNLPLVDTSEKAFCGLVYALEYLHDIKIANESYLGFQIAELPDDAANLYGFMDDLLDENFEGEMLTLVIAALYDSFLSCKENYRVEIHPVNQSGASSGEVSDLDIYKGEVLYIANELKDKAFTDADIKHAADKVAAIGKSQMNFIVGRHGSCPQDMIDAIVDEYLDHKFVINVIDVDSFILSMLNLTEKISIERYLKFIVQSMFETKFKEKTRRFVKEKISQHFGI
jgi:hypothetical protein